MGKEVDLVIQFFVFGAKEFNLLLQISDVVILAVVGFTEIVELLEEIVWLG